jgi:ribosome maturation protein SDO1
MERVHNEVIDIVAGKLVDPKTKRVYTTGMIEKALDQLSSQSHLPHKETSKEAPKEALKEASKEASSDTPAPSTSESAEAKAKQKALPIWTGVVTTKSSKSQALDAMRALIAHQPIPVARARMRLRITCPTNVLKQAVKSAPKANAGHDGEEKVTGTVKDRILSFVEQLENQDVAGDQWEVIGFVEPGAYKELTEFIGGQTRGKARAEVLDMAVIHEGDQ